MDLLVQSSSENDLEICIDSLGMFIIEAPCPPGRPESNQWLLLNVPSPSTSKWQVKIVKLVKCPYQIHTSTFKGAPIKL